MVREREKTELQRYEEKVDRRDRLRGRLSIYIYRKESYQTKHELPVVARAHTGIEPWTVMICAEEKGGIREEYE